MNILAPDFGRTEHRGTFPCRVHTQLHTSPTKRLSSRLVQLYPGAVSMSLNMTEGCGSETVACSLKGARRAEASAMHASKTGVLQTGGRKLERFPTGWRGPGQLCKRFRLQTNIGQRLLLRTLTLQRVKVLLKRSRLNNK